MYKCSKDDPNKVRNEEREKRSVEISMGRPNKVLVSGDPLAPIIVPESRYVNE